MAELNFPTGNPPSPTTYTEAGITWTWNNTLGVWSTDAPDQVADLSDVHVGSSPQPHLDKVHCGGTPMTVDCIFTTKTATLINGLMQVPITNL